MHAPGTEASPTPAVAPRSRVPWDAVAAAAVLAVVYGVAAMRSWSIDGCLMVLNSDHWVDLHSWGHLLLRPAARLGALAAHAAGGTSPGAIYWTLWALFLVLGVTALTVTFKTARAWGAPAAGAWLALAATALGRDAIRQLAALDEKALLLLGQAAGLAATVALIRSQPTHASGPPRARLWLAAAAWVFAVFGHLQNAPFALWFALGLAIAGPWPRRRRWLAAAEAALAGAVLAGGLLAVLYAGPGARAALAAMADGLSGSGAPRPERADLIALARGAAEGWIKAWFTVDRLSPRPLLAVAAVGWAVLMLGMAFGFVRRRDAVGWMLAGGGATLMVLVPAVNTHPGMPRVFAYGDSYTALLPAGLLLLAQGPRAAAAAGAIAVALVTGSNQWDVARPPVTIQQHLARLIDAPEHRAGAPWVIIDELAAHGFEQEFCPIIYPMAPELRFERLRWDELPRDRRVLVEVQLTVAPDGALATERLETIQRRLSERGRNARLVCLYDGPQLIRTDWRAYGYYFVVESPLP